MIDLKQDYFALFGLVPAFSIDMERLEQAYIDIQARVHPDRFAHLSDTEKRLSMQWATHANEAFRTLKSPLNRGHYLLELRGVDPGFDTNTAMAPDFLMEQMEWREGVAEARSAGNHHELEHLHHRLGEQMRGAYDELGDLFDNAPDYATAADRVRRLMFLEKLLHEIDDAIVALEEE